MRAHPHDESTGARSRGAGSLVRSQPGPPGHRVFGTFLHNTCTTAGSKLTWFAVPSSFLEKDLGTWDLKTTLKRIEPIDRWACSPHRERRCTAHRKNGDRCKNPARRGTNVCDFHGAKAPQVKRKARQRIEEAADRMACALLKMATADNVADSVKLAAIRDALDRAGLAAKNAVEVELGPPKPYEVILETIETGSRAEYRRGHLLPGHRRLPGLWRPPGSKQGTMKTYLSLGIFYARLWPVVAEET
jgi:hypothetical protein